MKKLPFSSSDSWLSSDAELDVMRPNQSLAELTNFGEGGHYPGQFYSMHSIAVDSKGNLYTTETYQGRRVQKFVYRGLAPVTKKEQGTVWPTR